jgi:hypothetical protein
MAIAFAGATNVYKGTNSTSHSFSFTVGSGSDRILLIGVQGGSITADTVSATYNGVSATVYGRSTSGGQDIYLLYLYAPATGSNTVAVTWSGSSDVYVSCASYDGVSQSGFPDVGDLTQTNTSTSITFSLTTTADNCWLYSQVRNRTTGVLSASTGTTARDGAGTKYFVFGDSNGAKTPAGSHSMAWTAGSSGVNFGIVVALAPAGAPPPSSNSNFFMFM